MSSQELKANFKVATSPSHHQTRTIIKISKHEKRVEESDDKKNSQHQQRSAWSNEATSDQHRLHTYSMFYQNIEMGNEDFQEAASEATVLSSESGEKLHRHVLKIDLSQPSSNSANKSKCLSRRNVTTMSINQDRRGGKMKPFDGNLSDDQKLVLSVSDGASQCEIRNKSEMKHLNANVKGISLSGKCSPYEDHLDSGTCSDAEVISFQSSSESPQPPPVPPKGGNKTTRQKQHALSDSFCSDASSASSSDSVQISHSGSHLISPDLIRSINDQHKAALLPSSLLIDIRNHPATFNDGDDQDKESQDEHESNYLDLCNSDTVNEKMMMNYYSGDSFYKFHINEHLSYDLNDCKMMIHDESDESFAGIKDLRSGTSTIRSAKGTIRGVKNRVRNGIATFLQMQQTTVKNYKEKDGGKIVLYTTSMGIIRSTYTKCQTVKKILNTLMVKFEERDVFMSHVHQQEIRDRMQMDMIDVPQLFVDGQYIGNADQVERFNEMGELRKMLKTFKCKDSIRTCRICGGYSMLPCSSCGGSKKSIHRNHFTSEFIALKCMNCDEVGLVRCYNCS